MISPTNAFSPYIDGGGLSLGVTGGVALIGTVPTVIAGQSIALTANTTNYVQLNLSTGGISANTIGFSSGYYPIATVVTQNTNIETVTDSRPDVSAVGTAGALQTASVTLTSSQILNLSTTPVQVVPAPGAGFVIQAISWNLNLVYGGTAYSGSPQTRLVYGLATTGTTAATGGATLTSFWGNTSNYMAAVSTTSTQVFGQSSALIDLPLSIYTSSALTLGNGTAIITVSYIVFSAQ